MREVDILIKSTRIQNISTTWNQPISHGVEGKKPIYSLEPLYVRKLSFCRRLFDILGSLLGIILFSPAMIAISIVIKIISKGPVLFKHERTGQNMQRFMMYKFRTMAVGAENQINELQHMNEMTGPLIKITNDPRLTKAGLFLRKTSMDELPQLFNILKGDMTIVGPRALSPFPSQYENWQLRRFYVKPGLTCTWQAERRGEMDFTEWMRCDLKYMDRSSLWMDIRVLVKTILQVISCKGAH